MTKTLIRIFLFFSACFFFCVASAQVDSAQSDVDTIYITEDPVVITDYYFLPPKITRNWFVSVGFSAGKGIQSSNGFSFHTTYMPFAQVGRCKNKWTALIGVMYQNSSGSFMYKDTNRYELFLLKYLHVPLELRYRIEYRKLSVSPAIGISSAFLLGGSSTGMEYKSATFKKNIFVLMAGFGAGCRFTDKFSTELFAQTDVSVSNLLDKERATMSLIMSGVRFNYFF